MKPLRNVANIDTQAVTTQETGGELVSALCSNGFTRKYTHMKNTGLPMKNHFYDARLHVVKKICTKLPFTRSKHLSEAYLHVAKNISMRLTYSQ